MRTLSAVIANLARKGLQRSRMSSQHELAESGRESPSARLLRLTPRQREVLVLLCEGLSNKLIARRLNISPATVKVHIGSILRELGVASRLQAVVIARGLGLAGEPGSVAVPAGNPIVGQADMLRLLDEMLARQFAAASNLRPAAITT